MVGKEVPEPRTGAGAGLNQDERAVEVADIGEESDLERASSLRGGRRDDRDGRQEYQGNPAHHSSSSGWNGSDCGRAIWNWGVSILATDPDRVQWVRSLIARYLGACPPHNRSSSASPWPPDSASSPIPAPISGCSGS